MRIFSEINPGINLYRRLSEKADVIFFFVMNSKLLLVQINWFLEQIRSNAILVLEKYYGVIRSYVLVSKVFNVD